MDCQVRTDITLIATWYGEWKQLRRRLKEYAALDCPVLVLNDGWQDREHFARIVQALPQATAVSRLRDEGFRSHELRNVGMDMARTEWVLLLDMDISLPAEFATAWRDFAPAAAPRWMLRLREPVSGYAPFASDKQQRTKRDVHPNCHVLRKDAARYDARWFGQHTGDEGFFDALPADYATLPAPVEMESRQCAG